MSNLIDAWDSVMNNETENNTETKETSEQSEQRGEAPVQGQSNDGGDASEDVSQKPPVEGQSEDFSNKGADNDTAPDNDEPKQQFGDEDVLSYLNEQLGTEYKTLSDLKKDENVSNDELNPTAKSINDYVKETNRGLNDWIKLQNLSSHLNDAKDEDIVRLQYEYDNPHLDPKEAAELFESEFVKKTIDEDFMDESEIAAAQKHNRLVDIRLKSASVKAKESLQSQIEKYKAPEQKSEESDFDEEGFTKNYNDFLQNEIEELEFDLGGGQTFSVKVDDNLKSTSINTPKDFLDSFVDEQGQWDVEKWTTAMMAVQHIDKIIKIAANQKSSEAKEEIIKKDLKNTSIDTHKKQENNNASGDSPWKTIGDALWG